MRRMQSEDSCFTFSKPMYPADTLNNFKLCPCKCCNVGLNKEWMNLVIKLTGCFCSMFDVQSLGVLSNLSFLNLSSYKSEIT